MDRVGDGYLCDTVPLEASLYRKFQHLILELVLVLVLVRSPPSWVARPHLASVAAVSLWLTTQRSEAKQDELPHPNQYVPFADSCGPSEASNSAQTGLTRVLAL